MFSTECIISDCRLENLRDKAVYIQNKQSGTKKVVDVIVWGDKPIEIEVPPDRVVSLKLGVVGFCRLVCSTSMVPRPYMRDDGVQGVSYLKTDRDLVFKEFAEKK